MYLPQDLDLDYHYLIGILNTLFEMESSSNPCIRQEASAILYELFRNAALATNLLEKLWTSRSTSITPIVQNLHQHRIDYKEKPQIGNSPRWSNIYLSSETDIPTVIKTGPNVRPSEAANMQLICSKTTIPAPEVLDCWLDPKTSQWCIQMTYLSAGVPLDEIYHQLDIRAKEYLVAQLQEILSQMRTLRNRRAIAGANGHPSCDQMLQRHQDVYTTERDFREHMADGFLDRTLDANEHRNHVVKGLLATEDEEDSDLEIKAIGKALYDLEPDATGEYVFSHGNFTPRNILVAIDRARPKVVGILDWSQAGFYPAYWEYVKMWCCEQVETTAATMLAGPLEAAEPDFLRDLMPDRLLAEKYVNEAKVFRRAYRAVWGHGDSE